MLILMKCILAEYKSMVMNIFYEHASNTTTKGNLDLLCDVETFMGLNCILPLLECIHLWYCWCSKSLWRRFVHIVCWYSYKLRACWWSFSNIPCNCASFIWSFTYGLDFWTYFWCGLCGVSNFFSRAHG